MNKSKIKVTGFRFLFASLINHLLLLKVAGVMVFSAIPFTAVKAIANSPLGEALQRQMEQKKKLYAENSSKFKALEEKAREER